MNIEKIEINGHYVWVDKDADIKEGDYVYQPMTIQVYKTNRNDNSDLGYKIIAASPELNLEGVPSYVEWLAEENMKQYDWVEDVDGRDCFIKGYQTAEKELQVEQRVKDLEKRLYDCSKSNADLIGKINELPTWNDIRKAIELARKDPHWVVEHKEWKYFSIEEITEQLKQSKL